MKKGKLFKYLAAASGYIGIGLILGYILSDQVSNTPLWVGGLLVLFGAILLGMSISSRDSAPSATATKNSDELRRPTAASDDTRTSATL